MHFSNLSLDEKCKILWKDGEFIAEREYYQQKMLLYMLHGRFIEVTIAIYEDFEIKFVEQISEEKAMNFYWKQLPLPS